MKLNAPGKPAWVISLILGVVALLGYFNVSPAVYFRQLHIFWIMTVGWLVLLLATFLKHI